jgi:hypothetical protein
LCKWCGYYENDNVDDWAYPDSKRKVWTRGEQLDPTPKDLVGDLNPWRG